MKIVLLVLSGNADHARGWLLEKYPGATVDNLPREQLESGSWSQRLNALRSLRPDIFAVATERLIWQRGQNAMLLFGALGGATRVVLVDARGDSREETRAGILARLPARLSSEAAASTTAIAKSKSRLKKPRASHRRSLSSLHRKRKGRSFGSLIWRSTPIRVRLPGERQRTSMVLSTLRSSSAPDVRVISNDYIAGLDETKLTLVDPEPVGTTRAAFDLRNNLIFSAGVFRRSKTIRSILFIIAMDGSPGPASRRVCARACRCFWNTTDRKFGSANTGTCRE